MKAGYLVRLVGGFTHLGLSNALKLALQRSRGEQTAL